MRCFSALLALSFLAAACQQPQLLAPPAQVGSVQGLQNPLQAQRNPQQVAFFPVTQGFFWDYGVTLAPVMDPLAEERGSYTLRLEEVRSTPAGTRLGLRAQSGFNNRYSFLSLLQGPQGVMLQDMTFLGLGSEEVRGIEIPFLPAQLSPGYRWESEHWIGKVKGRERISVPAGSFDTLRIEVIGTYGTDYTAVGDYWLAEGLGVVKSRYTIPDWHVESVLRQAGPQP